MTETFTKMHTTGVMTPRSLRLPENIQDALDREARKRGGDQCGNDLAKRLLSLIVSDNLFDAVLDDRPAKGRMRG